MEFTESERAMLTDAMRMFKARAYENFDACQLSPYKEDKAKAPAARAKWAEANALLNKLVKS